MGFLDFLFKETEDMRHNGICKTDLVNPNPLANKNRPPPEPEFPPDMIHEEGKRWREARKGE